MRPWMDIDEIAYEDAALGKELFDAFTVFDQKVRTFREAKHALFQKGKSRGYFKPKGFSKGKGKKGSKGSVMAVSGTSKGSPSFGSKGFGKPSVSTSPVNKPGFSGCFVCGDMNHDYRNCPKRTQNNGTGGKGGKFLGYVETTDNDDDAAVLDGFSSTILMVEDEQDCVVQAGLDEGPVENISHSIMVAKEAFPTHFSQEEKLKYAVIDTGATETVGSMDALQTIMDTRSILFGDEYVNIDPKIHKTFRFGNAQTQKSDSLVYLPQKVHGESTHLGVYALDVPSVPVLLGIRTLRRLGAILNTRHDTVEFSLYFPELTFL